MYMSTNMSSLQLVNMEGQLYSLITSFYHALITGWD